MWVMQQYYVGAEAQEVVIFQGVRGDVLGVPLHSVAERTDIALDDLPQTERSQVRDGIVTDDGLGGARGLVDRLRDRMLEPCPPPAPPPSRSRKRSRSRSRSILRSPRCRPASIRRAAAASGRHDPAAGSCARAWDQLPVGELMSERQRASQRHSARAQGER